MKNGDGAMLSFLGGLPYVVLVFVIGWEAVGFQSSILWAAVACSITFGVCIALASWFPPSHIWLYPLMYALPTLSIGLIALTGEPPIVTFAAIGAITFLVGLSATYIARRRANKRNNGVAPISPIQE